MRVRGRRPIAAALILAGAACSSASIINAPIDPGTGTNDPSTAGDDAGLPDGGVDGTARDARVSPPLSAGVRIIVEPSDHAQALITAISGAKQSVHMTMYLLSSTGVINGLVAQKNQGHDVKVVLNQNFPQGGSNASSFDTLKSAGIDVVWASSGFSLTHEKCVIVDGAEAWIMTMNATQSSPTDNREYLAVDTEPEDVAEAEAIFQADHANLSITPKGKLLVAPNGAELRLKTLIESATTSIEIEGEEFSDSTLTAALAAKLDTGVAVRLVLAATAPTPAQQQAVATLKQHKAQVVSLATPYVHAKALVVDGASAYVGSANFTAGSLVHNRELGIVFAVASEVAKVRTTIQADFAVGTPN